MTPVSRKRLPSIREPKSGTAEGSSKPQKMVTAIGKIMRSVLETSRNCCMTIMRSFRVVRARMMGGWMIGTKAI